MEEETTKRVEELVAKRVQQELERRKDEIEAEVLRRVEEAKKVGGAHGQCMGRLWDGSIYKHIHLYSCSMSNRLQLYMYHIRCTGTAWSMTVTPLGTRFGIGIVL